MNSISLLSGIKNKRINSLLIFILLNLCLQANAEVIKVRGTVLNDAKEPVANVNITNMEDSSSVSTNEDGKYAITVSNRGKLKFTHMNYASETVNVKGQLKIDLILKKRALMIQEVVVNGRLNKKKDPVIEPTDIEIHGNWAIVRTSVSPNAKFKSYTRLLMQPYVYNETRKQKLFLKPISLDGREYNITQTRMYDFDISKDPLGEFIVKKKGKRIPYVDSLYMENINDLWRCDAVQTVENYEEILFRDTVVIANGVINPLKFLKFNIGGEMLRDSAFFPLDEPQLMDDRDEMHLKFPLGRADLDLHDSATVADLTLLKKKLKEIESNQDAQLSAFEINGSASPEGRYDRNVQLAAKRMEVAMKNILSVLTEGTRENIKPKQNSTVEGWQAVADLMAKDSMTAQAAEIRSIVNKYPHSISQQGWKIARLPFYNVVATGYLPRLRKVEYRYFFKIYRSLTATEINELYEKNYKELTKFEFFKLYRNEKDSVRSEAIARRALEVYPNFMAAACDLSAMCLKRGCADAKILERFVGEKAPEQVNLNQIVTLLHERRFSKADSIVDFIRDNQNTREIKAYTEVLNHRFNDENYKVVAASGKVNEVLMLLAMKKNGMAYKVANELKEESAENFYIKAVCANRASKEATDINSNAMLYMEALDYLKRAVDKDAAYRRIAENDADIIDLLKDLISQKGNQGDEKK